MARVRQLIHGWFGHTLHYRKSVVAWFECSCGETWDQVERNGCRMFNKPITMRDKVAPYGARISA